MAFCIDLLLHLEFQGWRKHAKSGGAEVLSSQYKCICINDIHCLFTQKWRGPALPTPPPMNIYHYVIASTYVLNTIAWSRNKFKTFVTSSCFVTSGKLQASCQSPRQASQCNTGTLGIVTGLSLGLILIGTPWSFRVTPLTTSGWALWTRALRYTQHLCCLERLSLYVLLLSYLLPLLFPIHCLLFATHSTSEWSTKFRHAKWPSSRGSDPHFGLSTSILLMKIWISTNGVTRILECLIPHTLH